MSIKVPITKRTMELPAGTYLDSNYKLYYADGNRLILKTFTNLKMVSYFYFRIVVVTGSHGLFYPFVFDTTLNLY